MLAVDYLGGEGLLTELTLELGKIVRGNHTIHFFLDLAVNPHLQAIYVDNLARTLAFAWGN